MLVTPYQQRLTAAASLTLIACVAACGDDAPVGGDQDAAVITPDAADGSGDDVSLDSDVTQPADTGDTSGDEDTEVIPPDVTPDDDVDADSDADGVDIPDPPVRECNTIADCSDGLECTLDRCTEEGLCSWTLIADTCLIGGQCRPPGAGAPQNPCEACDPATDPFGYTTRPDASSCDDGNACTAFDVCTAGVCAGAALECDDGNVCTRDECDPTTGCVFPPEPDGQACDDANACTTATECIRGNCLGQPVVCNDTNACTDDSCNPETGCVAFNHNRACSDNNACTVGEVCTEGGCEGGQPRDCDDGNACTIDRCDEFVGCVHLPTLSPCCTGSVSICDDGNPCTTDLCDPTTLGCAYENNTIACNDGDVCTTGDRCVDGECESGGPTVCDDGDDCTADFCRPGTGCDTTALSGEPCEDGDVCTDGDTCTAGVCTAGAPICTCEPELGLDSIVLTAVAIGANGQPGQGLNLDRNLATCSPAGDCRDGIDNALSVLAGFANAPLSEAIVEGSISLLLDFDNIQRNPFNAAVYTADINVTDPPCVPADGTCTYSVSRSSFDTECRPLIGLPGNRSGNQIAAGGDGSLFRLDIPFGDTGSLSLTLYRVRFEGSVTLEGSTVTGLTGIIGGAVRKTDLLAAINAIPDESLPIDRAGIVSLLNLVVQNDIDTDNNGSLDAASIGLVVSGRRATVTGIAE